MAKRRQFGKIRRLPSGRYQGSYLSPSTGQRITAPHTFAAKADANAWLSTVQADLARGDQLDETGARIDLSTYSRDWLDGKAALRLRTVELYEYLLRCYILPDLGDRPVGSITTPEIRSWHAALVRTDLAQSTTSKTYRLLRQIMEAAVDDRLRRDNPCRIAGAAVERSAERKIPSLGQVEALAACMATQYRAIVPLAAYGGLRRGECLGLVRRHVDLTGEPPTVTIERSLVYTQSGGAVLQEPKTDAGYRTLGLPPTLATLLESHLNEFVGPEPDALLFVDPATGTSPTKTRPAPSTAISGVHRISRPRLLLCRTELAVGPTQGRRTSTGTPAGENERIWGPRVVAMAGRV